MKGGNRKTIPLYNADINNPGIPNEQRENIQARNDIIPFNPAKYPPTASIQPKFPYNQPNPRPQMPPYRQQNPNVPNKWQNNSIPQGQIMPYTSYQQQQAKPFMPVGTVPVPIKVINQYVIGDQNPHQDLRMMNMIYEDMLPTKHFTNNLSTISERMSMKNYIFDVVFKGRNGRQIPLFGGLYSKLKTMDLNPYEYVRGNPLKSLPFNYKIYRSCYPVSTGTHEMTMCASESHGINLRMYRLKFSELDRTTQVNSDVWRDIAYYEYVTGWILEKMECPNFVSIIGYSIFNDPKIDFDTSNKIINNNADLPLIPKFIKNGNNISVKNPDAYFGDVLVAATESPTYNILQWASSTHANTGNVRKMIHTGYHPDKIWYSILFQILAGMNALMKHNIHIENFCMRKNILIKDLKLSSNIIGHWKYIINGIEYYIPNYGFVVLIDSDYGSTSTVKKMRGKIFDDNEAETAKKIINDVLSVLDSNVFDDLFVMNGGIRPPSSVTGIMNSVCKAIRDAKDQSKDNIIVECIQKYMCRFMNNRIGTILTKTEMDDARHIGGALKRGDIIVYEDEGAMKFGIFYERSLNNIGYVVMITKDNNAEHGEAVYKVVSEGGIFEYPKAYTIKQNFKQNDVKLDEDELLETYVM